MFFIAQFLMLQITPSSHLTISAVESLTLLFRLSSLQAFARVSYYRRQASSFLLFNYLLTLWPPRFLPADLPYLNVTFEFLRFSIKVINLDLFMFQLRY